MKKNIMNTFKKAKPAELEHCVAKDIQKLQDAAFNNKPKELLGILEHITKNHSGVIEQINKTDPSLFIAIEKLLLKSKNI